VVALTPFPVLARFAFEKLLGWRGVHIEASPSSFQALARNRPNQLNVHAAVCDRARVVHYVDYGRAPVRGIAEFMAPTFLQVGVCACWCVYVCVYDVHVCCVCVRDACVLCVGFLRGWARVLGVGPCALRVWGVLRALASVLSLRPPPTAPL
jgi:hypothetical protein